MKAIKKYRYIRALHARLLRQDTALNRHYATAERKFLVVRHSRGYPEFYDVILDWVAANLPEIRKLFELHLLPLRIRDWSPYILHVPWLQDPVQQWSKRAYSQARRLDEKCREHQIPVINPVDRLTNAVKSTGAGLIASTGIRTPRIVHIENIQEFRNTLLGMKLPLLIREDWGHGEAVYYAESQAEIRDVPIERLKRPIAVEFIDTRNRSDGLYRKYRYVAAGEEGIALSIHVQNDWLVRGKDCVFSDAIRNEELDFINSRDPNHEQLQRAREALDLDFVAFDYSYDTSGELVVWEANPYPYLHFPGGQRRHRKPAVERTLAAIIKLYLVKAGLPVPPKINELLMAYGQPGP